MNRMRIKFSVFNRLSENAVQKKQRAFTIVRMRTVIQCFCCLVLVSCSRTEDAPKSPPIVFTPIAKSNVPAAYKPFFFPVITGEAAVRSKLPFETISIQRTPCYGTCPIYEMVLHRDGNAELNAQKYLPKVGKFVGKVDLFTYGRLCYLIENSRFTEMDSAYRANWTDSSTCIVTVTGRAKTKAVSDYGGVGPIELWAIQELLDAVKNQIEWKPAN